MIDEKRLLERMAELEKIATAPAKHGNHGKHGRDGTDGRNGRDGAPGQHGKDGVNGKDGTSVTIQDVEPLIKDAVAQIPVPKDGRDGEHGKQGIQGLRGKDGLQGIQGLPGNNGTDGKDGETGPIGPMPRHEWRGTELRFEIQPGKWGKFVDLEGPKGKDGKDAGFTQGLSAAGIPIFGPGGSTSTTTSTNSYFPSGW